MRNARLLLISFSLSSISVLTQPDAAHAQSSRTPAARVASPSSALRMQLRKQILQLAPKLRHGGDFPEGADSLALPMARLGDWDAARRLATKSWTRDNLNRWRAEQQALRHDYAAAASSAGLISDSGTYADSMLLIARQALEHGNAEAAQTSLLNAMRALEKAPDSAQIAYAAWLWGQYGDREAARRVLWQKAWPQALKENESERKKHATMPGWDRGNQWLVIEFASQLGFASDLVNKIKHRNNVRQLEILLSPRTRTDLRVLRRWVEDSEAVTPSHLMMLAYSAARLGMNEDARSLRDAARLQLAKLPAGANRERAIALFPQIMLAIQLGESHELKQLENEIATVYPKPSASVREDFSLMVPLFRTTNFAETQEPLPRMDVEASELDSASTAILEAPASSSQLIGLKLIAQIYGPRRNTNRLQQIAEATIRNIEVAAQLHEESQRKNAGSSWPNAPVEIAKALREAQPGRSRVFLMLC